jgi:hypothetical protein
VTPAAATGGAAGSDGSAPGTARPPRQQISLCQPPYCPYYSFSSGTTTRAPLYTAKKNTVKN